MIEGMLIGAAIFAAGALAGRFSRRRQPKLKPSGPYCGCGHHLSYHNAKGCQEEVRMKGFDGRVFGETEKCRCTKYHGPEPLPEFYAPEIPS